MGFAREAAGRVCFVYEGVVHEEVPPEQMFSEPGRERTQAFLARIVEAGQLWCRCACQPPALRVSSPSCCR